MEAIFVLKLSDGEELVVEGGAGRSLVEDPRDRTIEARRLTVERLDRDEERRSGRVGAPSTATPPSP
jgi:hypothetical protein